jgi:hypothetical protein
MILESRADPIPQLLEGECLKRLSQTSFGSKTADPADSSPSIMVRTPKFYHSDVDNANQIIEYMPQGVTLLNYVLKHHDATKTDSSAPEAEAAARGIGKTIGAWLRGFTQWSADHDAELHAQAAKNEQGQFFRQFITFAWLKDRVEQYPDILKDAKEILAQVEQKAADELKNPDQLQMIHGDFWTGKYVLRASDISQERYTCTLL